MTRANLEKGPHEPVHLCSAPLIPGDAYPPTESAVCERERLQLLPLESKQNPFSTPSTGKKKRSQGWNKARKGVPGSPPHPTALLCSWKGLLNPVTKK